MKQLRGFTIIELMIALLIVGILTTTALYSYGNYTKRAYRADARTLLISAAQWMERVRTEQGSYMPGGAAATLPTSITASPLIGNNRYTITSSVSSATAFTVTATPGTIMAGDVCGNLSIDQTGLKTFSGGSGSMRECWGI